jgi:hypothetical protein
VSKVCKYASMQVGLNFMEYFRDYQNYRVAKYSVSGQWIYVVWKDGNRLFQCESYNEAKEWIDGATQ